MNRTFALRNFLLALPILMLAAMPVRADYPDKPIRVVIG